LRRAIPASDHQMRIALAACFPETSKMNDVTNWKVPKWPFFAAYAVLLGLAYYFVLRAPNVVHYWELAAACVALGAVLSLVPFYLDYQAMGKVLEINALGAVAEKIQNLEKLSEQINSATNHWAVINETVQTESEKLLPPPKRSPAKWPGKRGSFPSSCRR